MVITILSIVTGLVILNIANKKENAIKEIEKQITNTNMLTMMLETEAGTGNYEEVTQSEWPQDGYIFNESLSRCENGGTLSWDDDAKKVIMKSNSSDKCYVYFDLESPTFAEYIINTVYTSDGANGLYYHDGVGTYTNADQEAGDNSYRYSGADYALTSKASSYSKVYDASTNDNGLIKFYCETSDYSCNYIGCDHEISCDLSYYYVAYDSNVHYATMNGALKKALADGYIEEVMNNFVCFGSDAATCPNDNLYRIIGLFDDDVDGAYNLKLIKADFVTTQMLGRDGEYYGNYRFTTTNYKGNMNTSTIAAYRWNYDASISEYGSNNWTTSELNQINLNTNYLNYLNNLDSKWVNVIATTTWHLGSMKGPAHTVKLFYEGERNNAGYDDNPTTYRDEIGLMYPSDYGYAASPDNWATILGSYSSANANNWIYMGLHEWTLTSHSSNIYIAFLLASGNLSSYSAGDGFAIRPVFYLKSNVSISSGSGNSSDPYRLAI